MDFDTITTELQNLRFNKSSARRQSVGRKASERDKLEVYYWVWGYIRNYRGYPPDNKKVIQMSNASYYPKNQRVIEYAKALIMQHDPDFKYTSIQFAKNMKTLKHVDKNNVGESYIIALGDFTGGALRVYDGDTDTYKDIDIHNKFYKFNGSQVYHETGDFEGIRFTLTYFTIKNYD